MAFQRPTLLELKNRVIGDVKAGLGLQTVLRRSFHRVYAVALAGVAHTYHGHLEFIKKQIFADESDEEFLLRDGNLEGVIRNEATFTELNITITGTTGATLPANTTLYKRSDGVQYALKAETIVPASPATIAAIIVAVEAGLDSNLDDGSTVSLVSPVSGVQTDAIVDTTAIEGEALEPIEDYRVRVIAKKQNPPAGGNTADYIAFAKTVTGVTRVWVYPQNFGQCTVGLTFVEDGEVPIIPTEAKRLEVQAAVEALQPVSVDLTVFIPTDTPINPVIALKPNTLEVQAAVTQELEDMLRREANARGGFKKVDEQYDGKIELSKINESISIAAGEEDHNLISPTGDVVPLVGGIVTLGTPVFSTLV